MRFVYTLLSTMAEYSSGPVTPSMRKRPAPSKCPRLSHRRAVSISSSSPISLAKSELALVTHRR